MADDTTFHFNGIDATTGSYLFDSMSSAALADVAQGRTLEHEDAAKEHLADLRFRAKQDEAHFGVKEGIDPTKLEQAGWGVIFAAARPGTEQEREQEAIREALSPLLTLRKAQATALDERLYKEFRGPQGYRPGESKQKYLARLGMGPGPADPTRVPYFLLIVGSPQEIPFVVQYQIDVQYAVGRIHFDTIVDYANYARSVVAAETGGLSLSRELAMVGVANADDPATQLSREHLVGPLADMAEGWTDVPGWTIERYFDEHANKSTVSQLLGGERTPALLLTASHGMGFPKGDPRQLRHQGALLLADWPGPEQWTQPIGEDLYLSGDDIGGDAGMLGLIAFNFACYGGGTPEYDDFSKQAFKERKAIADQAFLAGLPRKMLAHPKGGALATIGHVERAWGCSFMWGTGQQGQQEEQLAVFESTLRALMKGMPVGAALEYFNQSYADLASDLSGVLEELEWAPDAVDSYTLASMWTSSNDARGYAVMGDPAVRISVGDEKGEGRGRESIEVSSFGVAAGEAAASGAPEPTDGSVVADASPGAIAELIGRLSKDLEVRTYVSDDVGAAAAVDRGSVGEQAELLAFTRVTLEGEMDVIVPKPSGEQDSAVWERHVAMVERALKGRAELVRAVLTASKLGDTSEPPES